MALQSHYVGGLTQEQRAPRKTWHGGCVQCNTQLWRALLQGWTLALGSSVLLWPLGAVRHHQGSKTSPCWARSHSCQHTEQRRAPRSCLSSHQNQGLLLFHQTAPFLPAQQQVSHSQREQRCSLLPNSSLRKPCFNPCLPSLPTHPSWRRHGITTGNRAALHCSHVSHAAECTIIPDLEQETKHVREATAKDLSACE